MRGVVGAYAVYDSVPDGFNQSIPVSGCLDCRVAFYMCSEPFIVLVAEPQIIC